MSARTNTLAGAPGMHVAFRASGVLEGLMGSPSSSNLFGEVMDTNTSFFGSIVGFFVSGGFWMLPIFAAQVVSLAIIAERFVRLYMQRKPELRSQANLFEADIKKGNLERVILQA